jgi:hypothetical protein
MLAVKWNVIPMSLDKFGETMVGVIVAPAANVTTADTVVNPVVPEPSVATIVI